MLASLLVLIQCGQGAAASQEPAGPLPDIEAASSSPNSFRIFNAVHSALRQWGSSIQHNGLSFFPVTVPEGNLFYHGGHDTERPDTFEWLAFEMEHASQFTRCYEFDDPSNSSSVVNEDREMGRKLSLHGRVASIQAESQQAHEGGEQIAFSPSDAQHALTRDDDHDKRPPNRRPGRPPSARGYLQTYRAARPLKLLYLDGMAAAKCNLGTLDSQDNILLVADDEKDPIRREWERADGLCALAREWGSIDGFVRMEAGFEIIYCDFSAGAGLDLVSAHGSPWRNETHASAGEPVGGEWSVMGMFEWLRASAARYHGLPGGRAVVDFSGMVSAFAYDVNTTNPDADRPDLPRIVNASLEERRGIRDRVRDVLLARTGKAASTVDWQAVVDNIVTRFSDRLWFLAKGPLSARSIRSELAILLYPFLDFPDDTSLEQVSKPVERCTDIHLSPVTQHQHLWTPEDRAVHAAVHSVSHSICSDLFAMRREAHATNGTASGDEDAARTVRRLAQDLRSRLDWTTWKDCGRCPGPEQTCFVAMFPFGGVEDHFAPRCKRQDEVGMGYFMGGRRR